MLCPDGGDRTESGEPAARAGAGRRRQGGRGNARSAFRKRASAMILSNKADRRLTIGGRTLAILCAAAGLSACVQVDSPDTPTALNQVGRAPSRERGGQYG